MNKHNHTIINKSTICTIALLLGMAAAANAAIIASTDITVTASGTASTNSSGSNFTNTADLSGLSGTLTDANLGSVTHSNGFDSSTQYLTQGVAAIADYDATLTYTFSSALTEQLQTIAIWNYGQSGQPNRSANSVDISSFVGATETILGNFALTTEDGTGSISSDLIDISVFNLTGVTSVAITINQTDTDSFGQFTSGLSEVAFQTQVVPEPSSTALLGLGGLALILRRRK